MSYVSTLPHALRHAATVAPEKGYRFLGDDGDVEVRLDFAPLSERAHAIAAHLQGLGHPLGSRFLLLYDDLPSFVVAFHATVCAGHVPVPVPAPHPARLGRQLPRLQSIVDDAGTVAVLTTQALADLVPAFAAQAPELARRPWIPTDTLEADATAWVDPEAAPDDITLLQYTSGSTGRPRGVAISHANLFANLALVSEFLDVADDHVTVSWLPVYHDMGLISGMLTPVFDVGVVYMMTPIQFLRSPASWLTAASRHRARVTGGPNFAYELAARRMSDAEVAALDLSSVHTAFCGAEPIRPTTMEAFQDRFAAVGLAPGAIKGCWGMAETTLIVSGEGNGLPRSVFVDRDALQQGQVQPARGGQGVVLASCGPPRGDFEVKVVDPEGQPCPADRVGELWVRGASVGRGYWSSEEKRPIPFDAVLSDGSTGWLRTGDLGFVDGSGDVVVTGRQKDVIILRGRNHYPQDLEVTAEGMVEVRPGGSAAVGRVVDGEERIALAVELDVKRAGEDVDLARVTQRLRERIWETHEIPLHSVAWLSRGTLPKTPSGKVMRSQVRDLLAQGRLRTLFAWTAPTVDGEALDLPPGPADAHAIQAAILAWLAQRLDITATPDDDLRSLGLDSLQLVQLTEALRTALRQPTLSPGILLDARDLREAASDLASLPPHIERGVTPPPVSRADHDAAETTSLWQQAILAWEAQHPPNATWVELYRFHADGPLDEDRLALAFQDLVQRHEVLRMQVRRGAVAPSPHPVERFTLQRRDLRDATRQGLTQAVEALAAEPLPIEGRPLVHLHVWRVASGHEIVLRWHQLVHDGVGGSKLVNDLLELYRARRTAALPRLPDLTLRYTDYATWERRYFADQGQPLVDAAKARLDAMTPMTLPGRPGPAATEGLGTDLVLEHTASQRLLARIHEHGATFYDAMAALASVALARWSGSSHATFLSPVSTRTHAPLLPIVGRFGAWVPMELQVGRGTTWRELLDAVARQREWLDQPIPGSLIFGTSHPFEHPVGQVILNTPNPSGSQALRTPVDGLRLTGQPLYKSVTSRSQVALVLIENLGHIVGRIHLHPNRFDGDDLDRLVEAFRVAASRFGLDDPLPLEPDDTPTLSDPIWSRPAIQAVSIPAFMRGDPMASVPRRPQRWIATEEAFATPELLDGYHRMDPTSADRADVELMKTILSGVPWGRYLVHQLLDLDTVRLEAMDAAHIDQAILSLVAPGVQVLPPERSHEVAQRTNDLLAERVRAHPTRFVGMATVDPTHPRLAADEVRRCVEELGFRGVMINSHSRGVYLDDPSCRPLLEAIETAGVPLYLHPRNPPGGNRSLHLANDRRITDVMWGFHAETGRHVARLLVSGVLDELPDLRILLGHLGEGLPMLLFRMDWTARINYALERSPSETFRHHFAVTTSGMFDDPIAQASLDMCLEVLGPERILFAADHPFARAAEATAAVARSRLSHDQLEAVAWRNAVTWFGLRTPAAARAV